MASEEIDQIRRLFVSEIPEVAMGTVEIKAVARERAYRTKVALHSRSPEVDCIGACVGVRGQRIKRIVDQVEGERIDLVRWNEQIEKYIQNALQPAEIDEVRVDHSQRKAKVVVRDDQVALANGRRGQNQRLASALCGYAIEVTTRAQLDEG